MRVESVDGGGRRGRVDEGARDGGGARRARRLPLQLSRSRASASPGSSSSAGTPFERHLRSYASRSPCARRARGRSRPHREPDPARPLAARLADDAPRPGGPARRSPRRDRAGSDVNAPRRDSKWWGWGDPAVLPELDGAALATLRERVGDLSPAPRAAEIDGFELPAPRAASASAGRSGGRGEHLHRPGGPCAPRDRRRLRRSGPAAQRPPRRCSRRGAAARRRRCGGARLQACAAEGVAVVPFGGGTSVVGGVEPLRGDRTRA